MVFVKAVTDVGSGPCWFLTNDAGTRLYTSQQLRQLRLGLRHHQPVQPDQDPAGHARPGAEQRLAVPAGVRQAGSVPARRHPGRHDGAEPAPGQRPERPEGRRGRDPDRGRLRAAALLRRLPAPGRSPRGERRSIGRITPATGRTVRPRRRSIARPSGLASGPSRRSPRTLPESQRDRHERPRTSAGDDGARTAATSSRPCWAWGWPAAPRWAAGGRWNSSSPRARPTPGTSRSAGSAGPAAGSASACATARSPTSGATRTPTTRG